MTDISISGKPRIRLTADGLENVMIGMGTNRDRRSFHQFMIGPMQNFQELEAAYIENWIARAIVDFPVDDSTREWRVFSSKEAKILQNAEKKYNVQAVTQNAFKWAGLYGGAGALMITDQDLSKPLELSKIKKDSLKRFLPLDRMLISGSDYNLTNVMAENYMRAEYFRVNGGTQQIHHSHFVIAPGAELPMRMRLINGGWDDSQLRRCLEDIKDSVAAKSGIASLILESNIDTITKEGIANDLSSGDMDDAIAKRYRLFGMMKSLFGLAVLDSNEALDRKSVSFGGLGDILSVLMEWTSGAAGIPMTRLFGVQAKGLGDSGQGDMNNYNNTIRGGQESRYRPFLQRLDAVLVRSTLGGMPDDLEFEFAPLAIPTDSEVSDQRLADAQTDDIRLAQGVVKKSQIARTLMGRGEYGITDKDIADIQADEETERAGDYRFRLGQAEDAPGDNSGKESDNQTT